MANSIKNECIKGLEICSSLDDEENKGCDICPYQDYALGGKYYKGTNCSVELMKDSLEYLKQQKDDSIEGDIMIRREYYVIQNKEGKFFKFDNTRGGCPLFIEDFEFCEKYYSEQFVKNFIASKYVTERFKEEFENCAIRKVVMTLE